MLPTTNTNNIFATLPTGGLGEEVDKDAGESGLIWGLPLLLIKPANYTSSC